MTENTVLLEKRERLRSQLAANEFQTVIDVYLEKVGRLIQKLTRNPAPPPFWFSAVVTALVTLLIGFLTSILLGEFSALRRAMIPFEIFAAGTVLVVVIGSRRYGNVVFSALRDNLLGAIESVGDVVDLERGFAGFSNPRPPLLFALVWTIVLGLYTPILLATARGGFVGFGPTILLVIAEFEMGLHVYYFLPLLALPTRLSRYQIKLFAADPSNSEVIDHLADALISTLYLSALFAALFTLGIALFGLLTWIVAIILVVVAWVPLIAIFLTSQYALAKIITRAKWQTLNEIQTKIERLNTEENIIEKDTMEAINRLMDYHDRIKATRNSALDLRAGLSFLNSLLLPVIGLVLGDIKDVIELLFG